MDFAVIISGRYQQDTNQIIKYFKNANIKTVVVTDEKSAALIDRHNVTKMSIVEVVNAGLGNRNIQRAQVTKGLELLEALGITYALKWRSDLYPISLNFRYFSDIVSTKCRKLYLQNHRLKKGYPDIISSLPDMYMFGHIDVLRDCWLLDYYDFSKSINVTNIIAGEIALLNELESGLLNLEEWVTCNVDNHSELYCTFRENKQLRLGKTIEFDTLLRDHIELIGNNNINYLWRDSLGNFRNRYPAREHNWITDKKSTYHINYFNSVPRPNLAKKIIIKSRNFLDPLVQRILWSVK